jgi:AcrR family transcriptional regulator
MCPGTQGPRSDPAVALALGRMGIREDQRLRTRRGILLASAAEFEVRGYEGTTYASVAARAGVAKSLVSYHFTSKSELVGALVAIAQDEGFFSATPIDPTAPLDELALSSVHVAVQEETNVIARAVMRLQREATVVPVRIPAPFAGWAARCEDALARAVRLGQVPAVDVPFESAMLVAQFAGIREIASTLGQHERFVERTTIGTLDRFRAMEAVEPAFRSAVASAVAAMRSAEVAGADRVADRYR